MQAAGDAGALQGLLLAVFGAHGHQAGHFGLGNGDFLAAELGELDVSDFVIGGGHRCPRWAVVLADFRGAAGGEGTRSAGSWGVYSHPAARVQMARGRGRARRCKSICLKLDRPWKVISNNLIGVLSIYPANHSNCSDRSSYLSTVPRHCGQ